MNPESSPVPPQPAREPVPPQTASEPVTAALLIIGDEILSGRTKDANLPYLADWLNTRGIALREARVVPDEASEIVAAVNALRARYGYVFTTGGIGPTHDDITARCIAEAFGVRFLRDPEAERRLLAHYRPEDVTEARLSMADMPEGVTLIDNPVSAAPGFQIANVFVLAGVPKIMQAMLDGLGDRLVGGASSRSISVTTNVGEGLLAAGLGEIAERYPMLSVGSYPYFRLGAIGVTLVVRGTDDAALEAAAEEVRALVRAHGGTLMEARPGDRPEGEAAG